MSKIPETIQARLLALGIPSAKHTHDALAGFFPREMNIAAAGLGVADLARVLVHFTTHGLFAVASTGHGTLIKNVQPGWHCCQFYRDFDQLLELVAPYIADGLENGEAGLWVMPAAVRNDDACAALSRYVKDVDARIERGQLELLPHDEWYLNRSGRLKSWEEISAALIGRQEQALARGFESVRAAGDAGWVSGTEASREFIDYEMKVNAAISQTKIAAICTYRADVTADELVAIVTAHQDAIYSAPTV